MNIDNFGRVSVSIDEAFDALYAGKIKTLDNLYFNSDDIEQFNKSLLTNRDNIRKLQSYDTNDAGLEDFDSKNQSRWFLPKDYASFPIREWLLKQCKKEIETDRVLQELDLFSQHNMMTLLVYLKYLVDTMRSNGIVWGVGRGSSVASYVLYLIGIHKINSLDYDIDINEFLKGESNGKDL